MPNPPSKRCRCGDGSGSSELVGDGRRLHGKRRNIEKPDSRQSGQHSAPAGLRSRRYSKRSVRKHLQAGR
jgi:hypothetical protein